MFFRPNLFLDCLGAQFFFPLQHFFQVVEQLVRIIQPCFLFRRLIIRDLLQYGALVVLQRFLLRLGPALLGQRVRISCLARQFSYLGFDSPARLFVYGDDLSVDFFGSALFLLGVQAAKQALLEFELADSLLVPGNQGFGLLLTGMLGFGHDLLLLAPIIVPQPFQIDRGGPSLLRRRLAVPDKLLRIIDLSADALAFRHQRVHVLGRILCGKPLLFGGIDIAKQRQLMPQLLPLLLARLLQALEAALIGIGQLDDVLIDFEVGVADIAGQLHIFFDELLIVRSRIARLAPALAYRLEPCTDIPDDFAILDQPG